MLHIGTPRKIDSVGRIVLPYQVRKNLGLVPGVKVQMLVDGGNLVVTKFTEGCIFTGDTIDLIEYKGKLVSRKAARELGIIAEMD